MVTIPVCSSVSRTQWDMVGIRRHHPMVALFYCAPTQVARSRYEPMNTTLAATGNEK
jgi:hypothetical protein